MLVVRHGKPIVALICKDQKCKYKCKSMEIKNYWFYLHQIARCVMRPMCYYVVIQSKISKFGLFLLEPTLSILKLLSLKKPGFAYNWACPFFLNDFSPCLGYFSMFCGLILDQHMSKKSLIFGMGNTFVEVVSHPPNITTINGRVQGM